MGTAVDLVNPISFLRERSDYCWRPNYLDRMGTQVLSLVLSGENRILEAFRANLEVFCPGHREATLPKRPESQIDAQWWQSVEKTYQKL